MMEVSNTKKPLEVLRDGAIQASIWNNEGENGKYLTVTFSRTYKKDDELQSSQSFSGRDMLVLAELARQAYCFSTNHRAIQRGLKTEPK